MEEFIRKIPKVELHVHLEGTLEPELLFKFAERNKVEIPFKSKEEVQKAYESLYDLKSFLDLYYQGTNVLRTEADFYDLTFNYLKRCYEKENIVHVEPFFDPQVHTKKGILFQTVLNGIYRALSDGEQQFGITFRLVMCFIRDADLETAIACYTEALPIVKSGKYPHLVAIGLDSDEMGYPPSKFKKLYDMAKSDGFKLSGHGGHDGPPSPYVWELVDSLQVNRIDHGVTSVQDEALMKRLKEDRIPLTVCPVSNVKIGPFPSLQEHPLKKMVDYGLLVSINSDDPAYLQCYISGTRSCDIISNNKDVFLEVTKVWNFDKTNIINFVKNSIESSYMDDKQKEFRYHRLEQWCATA